MGKVIREFKGRDDRKREKKTQTTTITKLPRVSSETPKIPGPNINPAPNKKNFPRPYFISGMQKIFKQERSYNSIHSRLLWDLIEKMRRRSTLHETAFTRWRFFTSYFIDVDTFYLFLNWVSTRVSDDRKYVCGRRLYACINTQKFKGFDSRQITSLPEIKKVIYTARLINHRRK